MTPHRILVGSDFSDTAALAVAEAARLALGREAVELHAICVLDPNNGPRAKPGELGIATVEETADNLRACVTSALIEAGERGNGTGRTTRTFVHVRIGSPVDEIVTLAAELGADLVILGTHGRRGLQRLWLGSVAERVVRLAACPVLVVRPKQAAQLSTAYQPEPPCRDCLARRADTDGQKWWCAEHDRPLEGAHHYGYSSVFDYTVDPYNKVH